MLAVLFIILLVTLNIFEKKNFTFFTEQCKSYIQYLHQKIFNIENLHENINSDFLSHQFKLKKVNSDITEKVKKVEIDKKGWF